MSDQRLTTEAEVRAAVDGAVRAARVFDIHTHLYAPAFGELLLYGIDELLTYHYLIAEVHRADLTLRPERFFALTRREQADLIWRRLFVEHLPVSEACRGVLTVLRGLGVEPGESLEPAREAVAGYTPEAYVERIFTAAGVTGVAMTNDPFDPLERPVWETGEAFDRRFHAALRLDRLLLDFGHAKSRLEKDGYAVSDALDDATLAAVRRWLEAWIERMDPLYLAVSLPPDFALPAPTAAARLIEQCVIPVSRERGVPFAAMPGVRRQVNPALKLAGDGVALSDLSWLEYLCRTYPDNRFLVTVLARENQHQLCVIARKFANLMPFGCWWFVNNPSLIEEMARMRFELLGLRHIPQHSDCRVLDQLLYKWEHFRPILTRVMGDKLSDSLAAGWRPTAAEIERDVRRLLAGNFWEFIGRQAPGV